MVAEVEPKVTQRKKRHNTTGSGPSVPVLTQTRVRNLYLGHLLGPKEIAAQTGLDVRQVHNLVTRRGWSKLKESKKIRVEASINARIEEETQRLVDAVAMESEELALGTLRASHGVLADVGRDPDAPRNLQALSQSAKNFVGLARQARGLDVKDSNANASGNTTNVALFFLPSAAVAPQSPAPRNVTPNTQAASAPIDVSASSIVTTPAVAASPAIPNP